MKVVVACSQCGEETRKERSHVNRSTLRGMALFCSRECFGISRRVERDDVDKKRIKQEYDRQRREAKRDTILAKKREYFKRVYDPEKARTRRKERMPYHVDYCRRYYADPIKRREKFDYDVGRRGVAYGEFKESWRLLLELEREIRRRVPDKYERLKARGYYDKFKESNRDHQGTRIA